MDLNKINSASLLEAKEVIKLSDFTPNVPLPIQSAKLVKTKFGESILLEFEDRITFLPKRVVSTLKNHLDEFSNGKYSIVFEGLKDVRMPSMGVIFKFIESEYKRNNKYLTCN